VRRRDALAAAAVAVGCGAGIPASAQPRSRAARVAGSEGKVLRVAFPVAETGFDPARIVDLYSRIVTSHIFEAPYEYDHLARPFKVRPLTAAAMPEVSEDFRLWTIPLRPGIFFQDDPAFGGPTPGKGRELVAADYVYCFKRLADPANRSPVVGGLLEQKIIGLAALRQAALDSGQPFDYDRPIEGLRALDRHTLQVHMEDPNPRFLELLCASDLYGAVAREVVEAYGEGVPAHPVGTGPFQLAQWRRSSLIVLERNRGYRERFYDAQPAPDDAEGQALLARLKGRRLPMIDRVEVSIIEEQQPRWLAFLNGQVDQMEVPAEYVAQAMPGGQLAPNLARQGVQGWRVLNADAALTYFNMLDPVVGGYGPDRVALRRAISLATDVDREIRIIRRGQAVPAQSIIVPHTSGFDPDFKSENGDYDPARAKALLDVYGWTDRDGDGWREMPDGSPLTLEIATQPDQLSRQFQELWRKNMARIGIRVRFSSAKWPEQLRAARAGRLQVWAVGSSAASPDGQGALARLYGPQAGSANLSRFQNDEFDRLYDRMSQIADGPERDELFRRAKKIAVAYMPYKVSVHRIGTHVAHAHLIGFRKPLFWNGWWHMVDMDPAVRAPALP